MKTRTFFAVCMALALTASSARALDRPDPEALRSSLTEMLSLLSLGAVSAPDQGTPVTQSGADFIFRLPLNGFAAPAGASVEAVAQPASNGAWDVSAITVPPAGALGASIDQVVSYSLSRQAMHGRLDPQRRTPSTLVADLGGIVLQSVSGGQDSTQTIGRVTLNATLTAASGGRLDLAARNSLTDWHAVSREPGGKAADSKVRRVDGTLSLNGLDPVQAMRLMTAARSPMRTAQAPNRQRPLAPAERPEMRVMLDAAAALLTRIEADQTLDGLTFDMGGGNRGGLDRMRLQVKGRTEGQLLNAGIDVAMDELSLASLSADSASLLPHHLTARSVLAGVPLVRLTALLQAALMPNADQRALEAGVAALLDTPGARAAIESVVFDSGPLRVRGSVRFLPRGSGRIGADIHVSASGVDAFLGQAMGKPGLQNILPMVFLAKGMGRVQGDSVVWDISLGGGAMTVNGVALGQPAAPTR